MATPQRVPPELVNQAKKFVSEQIQPQINKIQPQVANAAKQAEAQYNAQMTSLVSKPVNKIHEFFYLSTFFTLPVLTYQVFSHRATKQRLQSTQEQLMTSQDSLLALVQQHEEMKATLADMDAGMVYKRGYVKKPRTVITTPSPIATTTTTTTAPTALAITTSSPEATPAVIAETTTTTTTQPTTTTTPATAIPATTQVIGQPSAAQQLIANRPVRPRPRHPSIDPLIVPIHEKIYKARNGYAYFYDADQGVYFLEADDGFFYPEDDILEAEKNAREKRKKEMEEKRQAQAEDAKVRRDRLAEEEERPIPVRNGKGRVENKPPTPRRNNNKDDDDEEDDRKSSPRRAAPARRPTREASPPPARKRPSAKNRRDAAEDDEEEEEEEKPKRNKPVPKRPLRPRRPSGDRNDDEQDGDKPRRKLPVSRKRAEIAKSRQELAERLARSRAAKEGVPDPVSGLTQERINTLLSKGDEIKEYMDTNSNYVKNIKEIKSSFQSGYISTLQEARSSFDALIDDLLEKEAQETNGPYKLSPDEKRSVAQPLLDFWSQERQELTSFLRSQAELLQPAIIRPEHGFPSYWLSFARYGQKTQGNVTKFRDAHINFHKALNETLKSHNRVKNSNVSSLKKKVHRLLSTLEKDLKNFDKDLSVHINTLSSSVENANTRQMDEFAKLPADATIAEVIPVYIPEPEQQQQVSHSARFRASRPPKRDDV